MTIMTQDVASAILEMSDVHERLKNGVAGLIVIAEHAGLRTMTCKALCHTLPKASTTT